jgi:hypothetical protein
MRTLIITTAAALGAGLFVTPAAAAPAGYVGGSYVHQQTDPGSFEADGWRIDGAAAFDLAPIGLALKAGVSDDDQTGSDTTFDIGAHAFSHFAPGKLGAFVDYADDGNNNNAWAFGGEGQFGVGPATLAASAGWENFDGGVYDDAWGVGGEVRVFPTDNLRLSGAVGYADLNGVASIADNKVWTLGVGGEWKPESLPVSFVADYAHSDFDRFNVDADTFRIGARFNFGGSLKDRNDSGADLPGSRLWNAVF